MYHVGPMNTSSLDPLYLSFQLAIAGRYSIDRELGRGGMGVVYLAREVHLDRMVAIKLLPPERATDPAVRDRFLREARHAAKLSHPNIIPIHVVDEADGFVFYVMSFIDGETLGQRVQSRGPLPASEVARILREVAWALSHAHSHGLVHRDVKPDNILLEHGTGRVLVADFGIASIGNDVVQAGGSPEFMSPEQALGKDVDARSDVYSLGITAFYALSGRLPFEGGTAVELLARHVTEAAPPVASLGVPVPRRLSAIIDRCVAKDPTQRPATADALAEQLSVSLEQRREVPVALRAFVKGSARINHSGILPLLALYTVQAGIAANFGMGAALTTFVAGTTTVLFGFMVRSARRLAKLGFVHDDVGPAFAEDLERTQEERAIDHGRGPTVLERILLGSFKGALTVSVLAASTSIALFGRLGGYSGELQTFLTLAMWTFAVPVIPIGITYLGVLERRRDIDTEFWNKVWKGRIGKSAFGLAKRLLGKRAPVTASTHRATELGLSMAAESLYDSLPAVMRRELGDVPDVVRRLESDAQRLRRLYEELDEALGDAGDAAFSDAHRALRLDRDRIGVKLGEAVGSLETIRLNLLRLHAGSGDVASITVDLNVAADVSAEVARLLNARREVDRTLRFPRVPAPTPV